MYTESRHIIETPNMRFDATPDAPIEDQPVIGIIGMGEMGKMYAKVLSAAGWAKCSRINVLRDGHRVSRTADWVMYAVEAQFMDKVVAEYGPSTKVGSIVGGQTSVKTPEKEAFEKYLPEDVHIISCHSLHGPTVSPEGQPLVIIRHRGPDWALKLVENILRPFRSHFVYLSYEDHDLVTANTQAVTHAAFLSMGTAWHCSQSYPWEQGLYVRGIEIVKVNIMLRIYSNQWHVYAGLAILNPAARGMIKQYSASTTELFKLMLAGDIKGLRERVYKAREALFGPHRRVTPILLSEDVLDKFGMSCVEADGSPTKSTGNNALPGTISRELLGSVNIDPFEHLSLAATPLFRMWIGVAEYLFRSEERLDAALSAAVHNVSHRSDDLEFVVAARGWSQCVTFGSFELYKDRFQHTQSFFQPRFAEATAIGSKMIKTILDNAPPTPSE
ncbi:Prephenate dehydrogenase [Rhizoctonia solani]|uniref:Prephenate dehydrogenase n=1 Tax=Rhizoctonia solani TaxID=456999 RepID=A0A8H7M794_9AGAM|nr:Prephenate dehydrogenase [Rhizoctonia solani]